MVKLLILCVLAVVAISNVSASPKTDQAMANLKKWANMACTVQTEMKSHPTGMKEKLALPILKGACGLTKLVGRLGSSAKSSGIGTRIGGLLSKIKNRGKPKEPKPYDITEGLAGSYKPDVNDWQFN